MKQPKDLANILFFNPKTVYNRIYILYRMFVLTPDVAASYHGQRLLVYRNGAAPTSH